jgi:hypothetical protein
MRWTWLSGETWGTIRPRSTFRCWVAAHFRTANLIPAHTGLACMVHTSTLGMYRLEWEWLVRSQRGTFKLLCIKILLLRDKVWGIEQALSRNRVGVEFQEVNGLKGSSSGPLPVNCGWYIYPTPWCDHSKVVIITQSSSTIRMPWLQSRHVIVPRGQDTRIPLFKDLAFPSHRRTLMLMPNINNRGHRPQVRPSLKAQRVSRRRYAQSKSDLHWTFRLACLTALGRGSSELYQAGMHWFLDVLGFAWGSGEVVDS